MTAILGLLNIIPGWVWAAALAGAMLTNCMSVAQRDLARRDLGNLQVAVSDQKAKASQMLAAETAKALAAERRAAALKDQLEAEDAKNRATVEKMAADLRSMSRAGGGIGLRDPNAPKCPSWGSGGGAQSPTPAAASSGAGNPAETSGLLSKPLEELFLTLTAEADQINRAYIACRADSLNIRGLP